jgi:preprotein translocase SecE subunit
MAEEKKGLLTIYKRGQGLWTRIGLASVIGVFILWLLVSLDAAFLPEVRFINASEILLSANGGKTVLTTEDLNELDKYGIPSVQIDVEPKGEEQAEEPRYAKTAEIRELIDSGRVVHLYGDVAIDTRVTPQLIEELKKNKSLDERISFTSNGEIMVGNWQLVEQEFNAGKDVRFKGDVTTKTWWRRTLFTVPVIQVEVTNGNIVIILLCVLGFYGVFRMTNAMRNAEFLIETESELKKVDWSSKDEVFGSTKIVLLLTAVFIVLMTVFDFFYQGVMALIKKACIPGA